jgi:hypothetical protein
MSSLFLFSSTCEYAICFSITSILVSATLIELACSINAFLNTSHKDLSVSDDAKTANDDSNELTPYEIPLSVFVARPVSVDTDGCLPSKAWWSRVPVCNGLSTNYTMSFSNRTGRATTRSTYNNSVIINNTGPRLAEYIVFLTSLNWHKHIKNVRKQTI